MARVNLAAGGTFAERFAGARLMAQRQLAWHIAGPMPQLVGAR